MAAKVVREIGGSTLTIKSGGTLTLDPGANALVPRVAKVALAAVDTAGGLFAWQNPEAGAIAIKRVFLDVTTKTAAAATADVGTTATSAATLSDNLIDGLDINAATGLFGNLGNPGTNGKTSQRLASGKWVTGSIASGASAGIVGSAYVEYVVL
jgi:hypothetical protein